MKIRIILAVVAMIFMVNGCSSSKTSSTDDGVEATIGIEGGTIKLSSGFTVTFPEGAVDRPLAVSVKETALPAPLPEGIIVASSVYEIDANNTKLDIPAMITFPATEPDLSTQEGKVGIYRWDGTQWTFVGGRLNDNTISDSVNSFSLFVLGTNKTLHFPVEFVPYNTEDVIVSVYRYILAHPDLDAPIAANKAGVVWRAGAPGAIYNHITFLPQGSYTFCKEWEVDTTDGRKSVYGFMGSFFQNNPAVSLDEHSSLEPPAYVYVESNAIDIVGEGRCPVPQAWVAGAVSVDSATASDFAKTFNALDPNRTPEALRAIFTFNIDGTFTATQWLNGVQSTFSGTWSYDPSTRVFSFAVTNGAVFSGQVVGSINNFVINGTWSGGAPGQTHLYI